VLGVAKRQFAREHELLRHVRMNVLSAFGDDAVKRPQPDIGEQNEDDMPFAPERIAERIEKTFGTSRDGAARSLSV
jgi:hypothetical protein